MDQQKAIDDTKHDMESGKIMDRLVCGDVGFGKTEVAIRAAFKAVQDNRQVAYLVPTTILAEQHYNTFCERMKNLSLIHILPLGWHLVFFKIDLVWDFFCHVCSPFLFLYFLCCK